MPPFCLSPRNTSWRKILYCLGPSEPTAAYPNRVASYRRSTRPEKRNTPPRPAELRRLPRLAAGPTRARPAQTESERCDRFCSRQPARLHPLHRTRRHPHRQQHRRGLGSAASASAARTTSSSAPTTAARRPPGTRDRDLRAVGGKDLATQTEMLTPLLADVWKGSPPDATVPNMHNLGHSSGHRRYT
jgi:hypothetical protein